MLLRRAHQAADRREIHNIALAVAHASGFEHFSYIQSIWLAGCHPMAATLTSLPGDWQRRQVAEQHVSTDPVLAHCWCYAEPVIWSECPPWTHTRGRSAAMGWAQGVPAPHGLGSRGMFMLFRSSSELKPGDLKSVEPFLSRIAHAIHAAALRLSDMHLTQREREVLQWSAAGKTTPEVAQILRVSENTVKFHLKNVTVKLGVTNKTAAAVKAALLGLLQWRPRPNG
jgi:LuxR family quorum-sensing system transcriptional regulator SolR